MNDKNQVRIEREPESDKTKQERFRKGIKRARTVRLLRRRCRQGHFDQETYEDMLSDDWDD